MEITKHETRSASISGFLEIAKQLALTGYFLDEDRSLDPQKLIARSFARILAGHELGIGPMASMQNVHIVKGKTSLGYSLVAGLIRRHPSYDYKVIERTEKKCTLEFYNNDELLGSITWTIEMAKRAGLIKKGGGWETYPENLLFARAMTTGANTYCPDVCMGSIYTPEELGEEPQEAEYTVDDEPFTDKERKTFHALGSMVYGDEWDESRHKLAEWASDGRTSSSTELTRAEFLRVLKGLEKKKAEQNPVMIGNGKAEDAQESAKTD